MLINPPSSEPLRVVAIDPGTTTMGVSLLEWDVPLPIKRVVDAFTLKTPNSELSYGSAHELYGSRQARIQWLGQYLDRIMYNFRPHAFIAEAPFLGRFPQAGLALTEVICELRQVIQRYDSQLPLWLVDPPTAKRAAGVKLRKGMDKEDVRRALMARNDLQWCVDPTTLDEHSIDATAVGLYYLIDLA